ncbi:TPA: hypothetical protein ACH3X2_010779 [Trebouxia sp. C0005]
MTREAPKELKMKTCNCIDCFTAKVTKKARCQTHRVHMREVPAQMSSSTVLGSPPKAAGHGHTSLDMFLLSRRHVPGHASPQASAAVSNRGSASLREDDETATNYPVSNSLTNWHKPRCQSSVVCLTGRRHVVIAACLVLQSFSDVKHCNLVAKYSLVCTRHMRQTLIYRRLGWRLSVYNASVQQGDDRLLQLTSS